MPSIEKKPAEPVHHTAARSAPARPAAAPARSRGTDTFAGHDPVKRADHLFSKIDTAGKGTITRQQYVGYYHDRAVQRNEDPEAATRKAEQTFDKIDTQHTGSITRQQLEAYFVSQAHDDHTARVEQAVARIQQQPPAPAPAPATSTGTAAAADPSYSPASSGGETGGSSGSPGGSYSGGSSGESTGSAGSTGAASGPVSSQPAPSGQISDWIQQALQILQSMGIDTSKLSPKDLYTIIMHESGGNPNSQNNWDSNAAAGHPSIGLMQTIGPTFDAYKLPGHDNIRNPVDNIIAGARYILSRYHGTANVPGIVSLNSGGAYQGY